MKKEIIIFVSTVMLLIGGMGSLQAQRPVWDTLRSMDTTYFPYRYNWFLTITEDTTMRSTLVDLLLVYGVDPFWPDLVGNYSEGNYRAGTQMFTDRPIKILGIAACAEREEAHHTTWPEYVYWTSVEGGYYTNPEYYILNTLDTTLAGRVNDSLILYKATDKGPQMMAAGPWRVEYEHRYMVLPPRNEFPERIVCDEYNGVPRTYDTIPKAPLYEVIFDTPQVVADSFIVVGTSNNNSQSVLTRTEWSAPKAFWDRNRTLYWSIISYTDDADTDNVSWLKYKNHDWVRLRPGAEGCNGRWGPRIYEPQWLRFFRVIFPIINPDFDTVLCDGVRDVRLADSTDTTLTVMWNGGNNVQWEVEWIDLDAWTSGRVTTAVPMVTLTGLRERTNYYVRVRGMCEWDTEYGPWSDMLDVYTGAHHDGPPQSASNLDRFTRMMPNPARGPVTVLSSYRLSRVVVYDLKGNTVLEHEDEGLTTTFDVSGLAKGVYVVAIHTPAGIATKRLVVEGN